MKFLIIWILIFSVFTQVNSQCELQIWGIRSDDTDTILLKANEDISLGSTFYITDKSWWSSNDSFSVSEGVITWSTSVDIDAGTFFYITDASPNISSTLGTVSVSGNFSLTASGETVYILNQFPSSSMSPASTICMAIQFASGAGDGELPPNVGIDGGTLDNLKYSGSGDFFDPANWVGNSDPLQFSLPVQVGYYKLKINSDLISVLWSTLSESNNSHFTIEHSTDGKTWNEVGRVEAQLNRSNEKDYSFEHHQPAHGINYYRLNQFDLDGTKTTFDVLAGFFKGSEETFLFPTIAEDAVYISGETKGKLQVIDAQGRMVQQMNYQSGNPISTTNLSSGQYFLKLEDQTFTFFKP